MATKRDISGVRTAQDLERKLGIADIKKATEQARTGVTKVNQSLNDFVNETLEEFSKLQQDIDGKTEIWFYQGTPSLSNYPASSWTADEYENHVGDLCYDRDTGYAYGFTEKSGYFGWERIIDKDLTEALALAEAAKDTADDKRRVFITTPFPPYDKGDLWFDKNSEIYICDVARQEGTYQTGDFIIATEYTEKIEAVDGKVVVLQADMVKVSGKITAAEGEIDDIKAKNITIEKGLTAAEADIDDLQTENIVVEKRLTAAEAKVGNLSTDVADINTLMFGSASGSVLQTEFADAVVALISDATIGSAKIVSVIADKITSGQLNTNKVNIRSDSGRLQITGDAIIVKDASRTRVQIGKDANNDYNIYVLDASGNIMFDATGVHADAIKSPIIVNDMVSDNANISAGKLDIDSLFTEINGSDKTINSTKILIDTKGQTLDMAFGTVTESIGVIETSLTSQGTELEAIQGKIETKIWQEDITTATTDMATRTDITNMSTQIEAKIDGLQISVEETYTTKSESANQKEELLETVRNEIDISSGGILLNLENVEKQVSDVDGELKEYVDYTRGFIKAGVLFFDSADVNGTQTPIKKIGVAIGQNLGKATIVDPDTGEEIEGIAQQGLYSVFTADRLSFYQNTAEVAYISNEKLYIKKAEIFEGYLKIGKWLVNTDNDFFNLEWEG